MPGRCFSIEKETSAQLTLNPYPKEGRVPIPPVQWPISAATIEGHLNFTAPLLTVCAQTFYRNSFSGVAANFIFIATNGMITMTGRRTFLKLCLMPVAALPFAYASCAKKESHLTSALSHPGTLLQLCDSTALNEIGLAYRAARPGEDNYNTLQRRILVDATGKPINFNANKEFVQESIRKNIGRDFERGNVIKLNGWILSVTEARQCAVFSFLNSSKP